MWDSSSISSADAQQRFRRTSFPLNSFVVNPAVAGTEPYAVAGMSYRNQWAGFEAGPTTMLVSGHSSVAKTLEQDFSYTKMIWEVQ